MTELAGYESQLELAKVLFRNVSNDRTTNLLPVESRCGLVQVAATMMLRREVLELRRDLEKYVQDLLLTIGRI